MNCVRSVKDNLVRTWAIKNVAKLGMQVVGKEMARLMRFRIADIPMEIKKLDYKLASKGN